MKERNNKMGGTYIPLISKKILNECYQKQGINLILDLISYQTLVSLSLSSWYIIFINIFFRIQENNSVS